MIDAKGKLYIGRQWDLKTRDTLDEVMMYDPDDLTTHAVVVGMTGSGKTGLCIDMLEEAAATGRARPYDRSQGRHYQYLAAFS